jgi:hypothetical protein
MQGLSKLLNLDKVSVTVWLIRVDIEDSSGESPRSTTVAPSE